MVSQHIIFEDENETDLAKRVKVLEQDMLQLKQDMLQLKSNRDGDALILGDLYIEDVASEALQFALGEQPKAASQCLQFKVLAQTGDPRLLRLVEIFNDNDVVPVSVTARSIATTLDNVIDSMTPAVHNISLASLHIKIMDALDLLRRYPSLQKKYSQEYMLLENYDMIRIAFRV